MEKFANAVFFLLTFLAFASSVFILVSKEARVYLASAIIAFISIGGLYLLLKSPIIFVAQIVFFALGIGLIILWGGFDFKTEKTTKTAANLKTLFTPALLCFFVLFVSPFLAKQMNMQKINNFYSDEIIPNLVSFVDINILILSVLVLALLSGFYTIAFWRKK